MISAVLQERVQEFTFYSAAAAACELYRNEKGLFWEPCDIWLWAARKLWADCTGCARPLSFFLSGNLEVKSEQRWVCNQLVTVYFGRRAIINKAARWILYSIEAAEGTQHAFNPLM